MKVFIFLLAQLLVIPLALAQIPTATNTIFNLDSALEAYTLQEVDAETKAILEELQKPSLTWRLLGWGTYLACGTNIVATQYRKERTYGPYSPLINNDIGRAFSLAGLAEGSNQGSEWFRKMENGNPAWMARIGVFASCGYMAISNFRNGWKRR